MLEYGIDISNVAVFVSFQRNNEASLERGKEYGGK